MTGLLRDPNMVRDAFWISAIDKMFDATEEPKEPIEFARTNYMLARLNDNLMMLVKLPENAEHMSELEIYDYVNTTFDSLDPDMLPAKE
jgi:hypothetical protein